MKPLASLAIAAIALLLIPACGGGGGGPTVSAPTVPQPPPPPPSTASDPAHHLGTARFTTHQPEVLEQIGAHHAYARGLSGQGVRIGIEDSIVDYTQRAEFGNRVRLRDADGAVLSHPHHLAEISGSDVDLCLRAGTCTAFRANSQGDDEARNRWVQQIVSRDGWPTRDNSVFVADDHYSASDPFEALYRWSEVPTPYGDAEHGTIVASVAAGTNLGVAPGATIIPVAVDFAARQQQENDFADAALRSVIASLPGADRRQRDDAFANFYRENYAKFDIINRSYGIELFDPAVISADIDSELRWYRRYLPRTLDAALQVGTPDSRKTIIVYAAGNKGQPWSGIGADYPFYVPELRGYSLSVVATDPRTGTIAGYSNRCGPVPQDWNAARHGRHYCLAAPGTVRGLVPNRNRPGMGDARAGLEGTSYAAPLVSGSLALLKEHFRGTRGNTQIVRRMLDTADRSGRYGDLETYGAGHLDIEATLSPVGTLNAGQSTHALSRTALQTPAAFGSVAQRATNIELAAFDDQDFPFWVPLSGLISAQSDGRSPIPEFADIERAGAPATGLGILGLHWAALEDAGGFPSLFGDQKWVIGLGPTSASLARLPQENDWGYGFSFRNSGYLGSQTSGAFGTDLRSDMIWTSHVFQRELGGGLTLNAKGTLAYGLPHYEENAIFSASPAVMSAMAMRIGIGNTGLTVEQPLRAESGTGTFRVENGRIEDGRRLYDVHRVSLRPDTREVRIALRHQREALGGNVLVETGHSMNAGHVPDESESSVGLAYRMTW
ncbi:MAG: S8 family serine peptidase [Chloroflexi bacterium]|nr:S8 family serine peptidase [Chloroflexota bacterium]